MFLPCSVKQEKITFSGILFCFVLFLPVTFTVEGDYLDVEKQQIKLFSYICFRAIVSFQLWGTWRQKRMALADALPPLIPCFLGP